MSSPLLKFRYQSPDSGILAATLEALPYALSISENGRVIYSNKNFVQLHRSSGTDPSQEELVWRSLDLNVGERKLVLTMATAQATSAGQDSQHSLIVGRLVAGVAHDFNNLLTGILLYCDLMQSNLLAANPLWRRTEEIRQAAEQGAALIRQLMSIGREGAEAPKATCFSDVAGELESLLHHLLGERIHITLNLTNDGGLVGITRAQAQQVILNLAINARDAMPNGGTLLMELFFHHPDRTSPPMRMFEFSVSDSGEGMDKGTLSRAFDPFFTTKHGRGTGTGLATVKNIVESAGGMIFAETAPGQGTRMIVHLPEVVPDAKHPGNRARNPHVVHRGGSQ